MRSRKATGVSVRLPGIVLDEVFDECDRFESEETGGRLVGVYQDRGGHLDIVVTGVIGPGPRATRSQVSFYQDGVYQEEVFRRLEQAHPDLEHLGNWHTHHVNGLQTLSGGDIETYHRTVNHKKHNTTFFYALLVVARRNGTRRSIERYEVRHFLLRRGDDSVYEIHADAVEVLAAPAGPPGGARHDRIAISLGGARPDRLRDSEFMAEFFPDFHTYSSKSLGLYWRGPVSLIDGSVLEVLLVESGKGPDPYTVVVRKAPDAVRAGAQILDTLTFRSARKAVLEAQHICNRVVFDHHVRAADSRSDGGT